MREMFAISRSPEPVESSAMNLSRNAPSPALDDLLAQAPTHVRFAYTGMRLA